MRMRRSQNNRPFRRGPHGNNNNNNKPRRMEGLPADEPDLPPPGTVEAVAAKKAPLTKGGKDQPADPASATDAAASPAIPTEPPPEPLPPGPHLELEALQAKPTRALKILRKRNTASKTPPR